MSSCGKFLEEYSLDQKYAETAEDLNKLMVGEAFINNVYISVSDYNTMSSLTADNGITLPWLHVMDDDSEQFAVDVVSTDQTSPWNMLAGFHNWEQAPGVNILNQTWEDVAWRKIYKRVGAINAIIFQAEDLISKNKDIELSKHIQGEAYFLRAYYYFLLQNLYGSPFKISTAETDMGVPLKVSEKVEDDYFSRDNNQKVYNQIISDLKTAEELLEGYQPSTKLRVGIGAVRALQSRVYLYTEQYNEAIAAAADVEKMEYALSNLNTYVANTNFTHRTSSETIFTMGSNEIPAIFMNDSISRFNGNDNRASAFKISDDLINTFSGNDLRLKAFFYQSAKNKAWLPVKYRTWATYNDTEQVSCTFSFRFAEVLLNSAEAFVMSGDENSARSELQKIISNRYSSNVQLPQDKNELIDFIRAERRRELCFEGHRWFDLRRYSVNSQYPLSKDFAIRHHSYSYDAPTNTHTITGYYELKNSSEDAAAWQVPIPDYAIEFNRGSLINPIRPIRNVKPL